MFTSCIPATCLEEKRLSVEGLAQCWITLAAFETQGSIFVCLPTDWTLLVFVYCLYHKTGWERNWWMWRTSCSMEITPAAIETKGSSCDCFRGTGTLRSSTVCAPLSIMCHQCCSPPLFLAVSYHSVCIFCSKRHCGGWLARLPLLWQHLRPKTPVMETQASIGVIPSFSWGCAPSYLGRMLKHFETDTCLLFV